MPRRYTVNRRNPLAHAPAIRTQLKQIANKLTLVMRKVESTATYGIDGDLTKPDFLKLNKIYQLLQTADDAIINAQNAAETLV